MIRVGDCLETLRTLADCSVDAVVTDPPYGLGKEPKARDVLRAWLDGEEFKPGGAGFMGKSWDAFVPSPLVWAECLRVLKPGGHLVAFAGSRTYDWIVMGVRLAGFEVRDQLIWMYGSGFPKSMNVSKAIDRAAGAEREVVGVATYGDGHTQNSTESIGYGGCEPAADTRAITAPATDDARTWEGYGTALKPAHEPIVMARKPLSGSVAKNVLEHGTGAINVDGCRVGTGSESIKRSRNSETGALGSEYQRAQGYRPDWHRENVRMEFAAHVQGRWPANILHDGSPEVLAVFPETGKSAGGRIGSAGGGAVDYAGSKFEAGDPGFGDTGSAARFFYSAKASRAERELGLADFAPETVGDGRKKSIDNAYQRGKTERRNVHPTVKPVSVMRWLVRLVGGKRGSVILDPYSGSGTTGVAAALEGFDFIGCDLSPEYAEIARARIAHARKFPAMWEPDYQAPEDTPRDQLDLFGELYAEPKDQRIAAGAFGSQKPSDAHRRQAGAAPDSNHESPASE